HSWGWSAAPAQRGRPRRRRPVSPGRIRQQETRKGARTRGGRGSALAVKEQLLANDVVRNPRGDVILQAVGQRDQQIVDALLLDDLRQELARLAAVVLPQKASDGVQRDFALKIQVHVVDEVPDKLLHERPPYGPPGGRPTTALGYSLPPNP